MSGGNWPAVAAGIAWAASAREECPELEGLISDLSIGARLLRMAGGDGESLLRITTVTELGLGHVHELAPLRSRGLVVVLRDSPSQLVLELTGGAA